ncbi:MAG: hypothetical protein DWB56_16110 [Candidatus Jettenia sp.]|uniref:Uncharacterized protein n=1 Tax=Candidatus Jettenia caeni TaxID=247490 RepID=I3IHZ1_9BACT|nr:MAG: hypothetical protein EDM77_15660 [Candidatus Jettenia sp. AMX1]MBC6930448.1 hypothetical protein [Candidatus Jettenia sp.]MCE7882088.1 hypothetical protein [Candidatus Jettenia sp. AMX1]MCQ3928598.1 hypothetical protein [Candidatus Jettenia sp.]GAB61336.1 hypothetical protein KSU1_B0479 [Candidatus Jettenia caeni]
MLDKAEAIRIHKKSPKHLKKARKLHREILKLIHGENLYTFSGYIEGLPLSNDGPDCLLPLSRMVTLWD